MVPSILVLILFAFVSSSVFFANEASSFEEFPKSRLYPSSSFFSTKGDGTPNPWYLDQSCVETCYTPLTYKDGSGCRKPNGKFVPLCFRSPKFFPTPDSKQSWDTQTFAVYSNYGRQVKTKGKRPPLVDLITLPFLPRLVTYQKRWLDERFRFTSSGAVTSASVTCSGTPWQYTRALYIHYWFYLPEPFSKQILRMRLSAESGAYLVINGIERYSSVQKNEMYPVYIEIDWLKKGKWNHLLVLGSVGCRTGGISGNLEFHWPGPKISERI